MRVDSTAEQYEGWDVQLHQIEIDLKGYVNCREKLLSDDATRVRYEILKARVEAQLDK